MPEARRSCSSVHQRRSCRQRLPDLLLSSFAGWPISWRHVVQCLPGLSVRASILDPMARDWEATLRSWVKPPSDNEDTKRDRTEAEIKEALKASSSLKGVKYKVYAKGSYANNTNVRLDYDVDIAVECFNFFYYDKEGVGADVRKAAALEAAITPYKGGYTSDDFKRDVEQALVDYYGRTAVTPGTMAISVRQKNT